MTIRGALAGKLGEHGALGGAHGLEAERRGVRDRSEHLAGARAIANDPRAVGAVDEERREHAAADIDTNGDGKVIFGIAAAGPADDGAYYQSVVDAAKQISADNGFEEPIVVEADPARAFAPVKNAPGAAADTPESAQAQMIALHAGWLRAAGCEVAAGVPVEISPLFAQNAEELAAQITSGMTVTRARYFC